MGSNSVDVGSRFGDISILCVGCHCTDDELRVHFPLTFIPNAWIIIVIGRIMGARSNLVVGGITSVIFLIQLPL